MTHEYPDPDFAAYVTTYPWVGGDDGSVKPNTAEKYNVDWQGGSPDSSRSDPSAALDSPIEEYIDDYLMLPAERLDPDYQTSDGTIT